MVNTSDTNCRPLTDRIREVVESEEVCLPPLPEVATRLAELLSDPDRANASVIADLVHDDPAIAAEILRLANSAAFGGLKPISDLKQAIARLGMNQVGGLVTALAMKGQFDSSDPDKNRLLKAEWDNAISSALSARFLSIRLGIEPEQAFLSGLLHDVGKLLVLKIVDHLQREDPSTQITHTVLGELMNSLHCELGHRTLEAWKLPEPVCRVALHHHDPVDAADPLIALVQAADVISRKMGMHPNPDPEINLLEHPAVELLNLDDLELATLMVDVEDEVATKKSLF